MMCSTLDLRFDDASFIEPISSNATNDITIETSSIKTWEKNPRTIEDIKDKQKMMLYSEMHTPFDDYSFIEPIPLDSVDHVDLQVTDSTCKETVSFLERLESILEDTENTKSLVSPTPTLSESWLQELAIQDGTSKSNEDAHKTADENIRSLRRTRKADGNCFSPRKRFKTSYLLEDHEATTREPRFRCPCPIWSCNDEPTSKRRNSFQGTHSQIWNEWFEELINFRKEYGHCLVPHKWKENVALAGWVKRQRYQYKLKREGSRSTLTDEREETLAELVFVWDPHTAAWEERLNDIRAYKKIYGTCNVPSTCTIYPGLALWVKAQRRQYRCFVKGKRSHISQERINKLDVLGFLWNPRNLKL